MFGNEQQEQSFLVLDMIWCRHILIAACRDFETMQCDIRFFSRDNNLDLKNVLVTIHMDSEILRMNIHDTHLLVYTANNVIHYYSLYSDKGKCQHEFGRTSLTLRYIVEVIPVLFQQVSLEGIVEDPLRVRAIERRVLESEKVKDMQQNSLLVLDQDNLIYMEQSVIIE